MKNRARLQKFIYPIILILFIIVLGFFTKDYIYANYFNQENTDSSTQINEEEECQKTTCVITEHPSFIAHAGGGINNLSYTNSLEALNENYSDGFRYFEIDLNWTKDNQLVLIHDWEDSYKKWFNRDDGMPDSSSFKNLKMEQGLTQLTLNDLYSWLAAHPDAKIVTDIKDQNIQALQLISESNYQNHFVVQVYNEEQIQESEKIGYKNIILTLYRINYDNKRVLDIADKYSLFAMTMTQERANQNNLIKDLHAKNIVVYLHTINDPAQIEPLKQSGAYGFYTDYLNP